MTSYQIAYEDVKMVSVFYSDVIGSDPVYLMRASEFDEFMKTKIIPATCPNINYDFINAQQPETRDFNGLYALDLMTGYVMEESL